VEGEEKGLGENGLPSQSFEIISIPASSTRPPPSQPEPEEQTSTSESKPPGHPRIWSVVLIGLLCLGMGAAWTAVALDSGLRNYAFGKPRPLIKTKVVIQRVPEYITQDPPLDWQVGACVNLTGDGQQSVLVRCSSSVYAVIVSYVTQPSGCPYYRVDGSGDTRSLYFSDEDGTGYYCAIPQNPYQ